jgi:hypothetical protein
VGTAYGSADEDDVPLGTRSTAQLRQRSKRVRPSTPRHAPGSDADEDGEEQQVTSDDSVSDEYEPSDSELAGDEQVRCGPGPCRLYWSACMSRGP